MKKPICTIAALMLCAAAFAQTGKFVVESDIEGLPESAQVMVVKMLSERNGKIVDTLTIVGGKFRYEAQSGEQPEQYKFSMLGAQYPSITGCLVWVWNNRTVITGDSTLTMSWIAENELPQQREMNAYTLAAKAPLDEWTRARYEQHRLEAKNDPALKPTIDSLSKRRKELNLQQYHCHLKLMTSMPVSKMMMDKLASIASFAGNEATLRDLILAQYERLDEQQRKTVPAMTVWAGLFPEATIGVDNLMADGTLYNIEGNFRPLAIFAGKYILLDFWSISCGPCRMAEPELKEIFDAYGDKVAVVGINTDEVDVWKKHGGKIAWHNLNDGKGAAGIAAKYGITAMPTYILVDPQGVIIARVEGYKKGGITQLLEKYKVIE